MSIFSRLPKESAQDWLKRLREMDRSKLSEYENYYLFPKEVKLAEWACRYEKDQKQ